MHSAVISDASCLIILYEIQALELLQKTYGEILTTPEIAREVGFALPAWIALKEPTRSAIILEMPTSIDGGEAGAIALALEIPDSTLIVDEKTARNYARRLGINVTGTLGMIAKAKVEGIIPSIKPYMKAIAMTDFRFSSSLESDIYKQAGEEFE